MISGGGERPGGDGSWTRRRFLVSMSALVGAAGTGCSFLSDTSDSGAFVPVLRGPSVARAVDGEVATVEWDTLPGVAYSVEHNGQRRQEGGNTQSHR